MTFEISELLNIPWCWGGRNPKVGLDCYGLCRYTRSCLDPRHELREFAQVYRCYTEDNQPLDLISRLLQEHCIEVKTLSHLNLVCLDVRQTSLLGTVLLLAQASILFMGSRGSRLESVQRLTPYIVELFDPSPILLDAESV